MLGHGAAQVKPKLAAKGKVAPKGEAVIPAGKAKGLAKAKALGDNAVAPVLPVRLHAACFLGMVSH